MTDLARLATLAARAHKARAAAAQADDDLRVAVWKARAAGAGVSELARTLGVSRFRVYQLLKMEEKMTITHNETTYRLAETESTIRKFELDRPYVFEQDGRLFVCVYHVDLAETLVHPARIV